MGFWANSGRCGGSGPGGTPDPDAPKPKAKSEGSNGTDNGGKGKPGEGETGPDTAGACKNSFAAGTLVLTLSGLRPIEGIEVGDLVWSLDPETGEAAWKPVVATFVRHAKLLMDLDLLEADGDAQELLVTSEHPFRTPDGWATVAELEVGDRVWARDGWATVASVLFTNRRETVYNFMVADFHTYAVGEGVVWTHNECGKKKKGEEKKEKSDGDAYEHDYSYDKRIRERGLQDPRAHNFPYSFDDHILAQPAIRQADGSLLHRLEGTLNGKDGYFEIAVNPDTKNIFHRTFVDK